MRIEERGCSMITDKQGREWLLQKLYDEGWRYMVGGDGMFIYLTKNKPLIIDKVYKYIGEEYTCIGKAHCILPNLEKGEVLRIAEKLGIVDWSKVKVDTPVLVKTYEQDDWQKRYFAYFKDGRVYAWLCGTTSWSADNDEDVMSWNCAKLAEV